MKAKTLIADDHDTVRQGGVTLRRSSRPELPGAMASTHVAAQFRENRFGPKLSFPFSNVLP